MTRLRFNLKDKSKVNNDEMKKLSDVIDSQWIGDQYQVVIGPNVKSIYKTIIRQTGIQGTIEEDEENFSIKDIWNLKKVGGKIIDYLSGSIVAIIPVLQVSGLALAVKTILGPNILNVMPEENGLMVLLQMIYNVGFYFLPVTIGYSSAKKLKLEPIYGLFMGMLLIAPDFINLIAAEQSISLFGLNVPMLTYTQTVFPIMLCMPVVKVVDYLCRHYLPDLIQTAFGACITFFISAPIAFLFIAPLGNVFSQAFAFVLNWVTANLGFVGAGIIGGLWLIIVMTGTHLVLMPTMLATLFSQGYENLMMPAMGSAYYALLGVELAALIKIKNKKEKGKIISYITSDLIGNVSEPSLFGICLKYKNALLGLFLGGFAGGALANILGLVTYGIVPSIHVVDLFLNLGAVGGPDPTMNCALTFVRGLVALLVSFFFCYMFAFKETDSQTSAE